MDTRLRLSAEAQAIVSKEDKDLGRNIPVRLEPGARLRIENLPSSVCTGFGIGPVVTAVVVEDGDERKLKIGDRIISVAELLEGLKPHEVWPTRVSYCGS